ncbi:MAG: ABC transporter substrate-binding protein [Candidatus Binatia bacterium]
MKKKSRWLKIPTLLLSAFIGVLIFSDQAISQTTGAGKSFEEIVKLAAKEGRVRVGSGMTHNEAALVLKGFNQKYPTIKVEVTPTSGVARGERVFNEVLGGVVEFDLYDVPAALQKRFVKAGVTAGPFEWRRLFPNVPEIHISPDGYFNASGFNLRIIGYNPSLVPANRIPKDWSDCLDPYWKGKVAVDTHPRFLSGLYKSWGEAKILEYAAQLKNNQPVWKRGQTETLVQVAAGEYPIMCGAHYASIYSVLRLDPKAKLAMSLPKEVPVSLGEIMAVMKGAQNPNAALLLSGWLASPDGQRAYDRVGRGSPFVKESEKWKLIEKWGSKTVFEGWDRPEYEPVLIKKIVASWGFPTGK